MGKQKKDAKKALRLDPELIDYQYMLALYRDQINDVVGIPEKAKPRSCYFSKEMLEDFIKFVPDGGGVRMYYATHFLDGAFVDTVTNRPYQHRNSTTEADYKGLQTLVLCKVDAKGNDILEITKGKKKERVLITAGTIASPRDGGSLCPPYNYGDLMLAKKADKSFPPKKAAVKRVTVKKAAKKTVKKAAAKKAKK